MKEKKIKKEKNSYIENEMLGYFENHPYNTYNDFKSYYNSQIEYMRFKELLDDKIINARRRKLQREGSLYCESYNNGRNDIGSKKIVVWENWK